MDNDSPSLQALFAPLFHGVCIISEREREPEREKRANELAGVCIAWEKKNRPGAGAFISPNKPTLKSFYNKKNQVLEFEVAKTRELIANMKL
jgi:hypothetical protein